MLSIRNISIRNKLVLMQVFTSVIVVGVFIGVFIVTDIKDYKERKVKSMSGLARVLSTNSIPIMLFQDEDIGDDILAELRTSSPDIIHAVIVDTSGKVFGKYARAGSDSLPLAQMLKVEKNEFSTNRLFVSDLIRNKTEVLGRVAMEIDLSELAAIKKSRYEMAFVLILGAVLFSFLVALVVQGYISRRLIYLVNSIKQVSRTGNYNALIIDKGRDEISTLIRVYNNLMQQVKESQQRKDEFIGIASHELKTPLTSIKGYLDLLNMVEDRPLNKQFTQKGLESVNKLENLIKDLLDVSKIQSGQLQLNLKEFNVDELINDSIASFQMVSTTHTIVRDGNLPDETIVGDRQRIEQVLINLLSNAIKYSPDEHKVIVSSREKDGMLEVQVRDFGIGIPEEEASEIFERFYRARDASIHISGFGLGLYICRDIITRHHGKIWVEREADGSSFYFSLPLKQ